MGSLWMVVADESRAELWEVDESPAAARTRSNAVLLEVIENPTAHTDARDLKSDVPGQARADFAGHAFSLAQRNAPEEVARDRYAGLISERLNRAHAAGQMTTCALVMAPRLLGLVRGRLHDVVRRSVAAEVHHRRIGAQVGETVREVLAQKAAGSG